MKLNKRLIKAGSSVLICCKAA